MKSFIKTIIIGSTLIPALGFSDLIVCNKSDVQTASVATGLYKNSTIETKGWFNIEKDTCAIIYKGDLTKLDSNIGYIHGTSADNKVVWTGTKELCTKTPGPFTYADSEGLCKSGKKVGFLEATFDDAENYTLDLLNEKESGLIEKNYSESQNGGAEATQERVN